MIGPPGAARLALEWRAPLELALGVACWPRLKRLERGDGHSVFVLPGLGGGDLSTLLLRRALVAQGWQASGWGFGRNLGPRQGLLEQMEQRIDELRRASGRKVSLIGWSLGGVLARELVKRRPAAVRQLITLGSPLPEHRHATNVRRLYEWLAGPDAYPPDLMARARATLLPPSSHTENIGVAGSHSGMGFSPGVLRIVANRLAQPEGGWRPYRTCE